MDLSELRIKMSIVFDKEERDIRKRVFTHTIDTEHGDVIIYPNAETLIDLYVIIKNDVKLFSFFVDSLERRIIEPEDPLYQIQIMMDGNYEKLVPLCFYTLVQIGFKDKAVDALKMRNKGCEELYRLISEMLPHNYFGDTQLKGILNKVRLEKYPSLFGDLLEDDIIKCRYQILTKQVKKVNVEINQDKKLVSQKISSLGFNKSYNKVLDEIDNFIYTQTSDVVNAGMINSLRALTADLLKDIANRIAEKEREIIPTMQGCGEMGNIRGYLKTKLEFSAKDNKFITSFIDILHAEGGHAFMSEKEYFRLARNIAIEIALFVLSKFEKKFKP